MSPKCRKVNFVIIEKTGSTLRLCKNWNCGTQHLARAFVDICTFGNLKTVLFVVIYYKCVILQNIVYNCRKKIYQTYFLLLLVTKIIIGWDLRLFEY